MPTTLDIRRLTDSPYPIDFIEADAVDGLFWWLTYQANTVDTTYVLATLQYHGQSFLLAERPKLSLPKCDRTCLCEFAELDDRRVNTHRRYPSKDIVQFVDDLKGRDGRNGADCRKLAVDPYGGGTSSHSCH